MTERGFKGAAMERLAPKRMAVKNEEIMFNQTKVDECSASCKGFLEMREEERKRASSRGEGVERTRRG